MPLGPLVGTSAAKAYTLTVNGVNIINSVPIDHAPIRWTDEAANDAGTLTFTVEDEALWASRTALPRGADVRFRDNTNSDTVFGGTLLSLRYLRDRPRGRYVEVTCTSYDWWLDNRVVPLFRSVQNHAGRERRIARDRNVVQALMDRRAGMIFAPDSTVDVTNTDMPEIEIKGVTVREALEEIADAAQNSGSESPRRFYVDTQRRLHWYAGNEGVAAPYDVGPDDLEVEDLSWDIDAMDIVHHAYVRGKNAAGSGWVYNTGSDFEIGAVSAFVDSPRAKTVGDRNRKGRAFLRRQGAAVGGQFSVIQTSRWHAGQLLTIEDPLLGLEGTYEIKRVTGEIGGLGEMRTDTIEFGNVRRSFLRDLRRRDRRR
jgi:hypothetical protein